MKWQDQKATLIFIQIRQHERICVAGQSKATFRLKIFSFIQKNYKLYHDGLILQKEK
jgi:hypothetical protein